MPNAGHQVDLSDLPDDPIERLHALAVVEAEVKLQLEGVYAEAYFDARLTGQVEEALAIRRHGRQRIFAMIRRVNYRRGSSIRWSDGLDT